MALATMRLELVVAQNYPGGFKKYAEDKIAFYQSSEGKRLIRFLVLIDALAILVFVACVLIARS